MSTFDSFKSLSRALFLGFRRDRGALFFTVLFPLLFLVIFGGVFGKQTTGKVDVVEVGAVPVLDRALQHDPSGELGRTVKVKHDDLAGALKKVQKGDADAAVEQSGGRLVVHYSGADRVKSGVVQSVVQQVANAANVAESGRPPTYTVASQRVEDKSIKGINFFTPSLLGWALASAGMFGASQTLVLWRTKGLLRRLRLAPVPIPTVFGARVVVSLGIALGQLAVFLLVAQLPFFGLKLQHAWWMSIPLVVCGVLTFLSLGMVVGAWAKTQETAQTVTQLIVLPMAFLGGSFFPLDYAPKWMQAVSYVFPLRYLNEGMLNVMARGQGPMSALPQMGILLGIAVVAAAVAARLFRWDAT
ncbi:ABC transporter permease [Actinomadura rupiterrae]|uniref:ABC transporter permease n=1 Tax=Actinomadura rupiterrae TaxID=559627 RepID=UPI0020A4953A|nr:ABC transporter permease [Actinomadura rupiterrae]MCP2335622.1 ABC-2 type transport system permease protein [Actinomadura rupiterrae]